jgi:hypothetical protein
MLPSPTLFHDFISQMSKDDLVDFIMAKYTHYDQSDTFYFFEDLILKYHQVDLNYETLRQEIIAFEKESKRGRYFEAFEFNKFGVGYIPPQTKEWFSRVGVLLDLLCIYARDNQTLAVKELFDILLDLIQYTMESGEVVFAHDYGESDINCDYEYRNIYEHLVQHLVH